VGKKFSELKKIAIKFYADKNKIEVLQELQRYSKQDILDAMDDNVLRET